jgi:hypothetical protein
VAVEVNHKRLHFHALPVVGALIFLTVISAGMAAPQLSAAKQVLFSRSLNIQPSSNGLASFGNKDKQINNPIESAGQTTSTELIIESEAN